MQCRVLACALVASLITGISGCSTISGLGAKEDASAQQMPLSAVPEPARIVIEKLTTGGGIKKIEKEEVDGKVIYDVEATVGEKDVEYDVASDGTVLTAEESVPYASLPATVQAAAQKYFGSATERKASREVENGKTFYEVEGQKKGKAVGLKLTDAGRIVEEEKQ